MKSMSEATMPIIIMSPSRNVMNTDKPRRKIHPNWQPYEYKLKEYWLTEEDENHLPYYHYRKQLLDKEKEFVDSMQKFQGG